MMPLAIQSVYDIFEVVNSDLTNLYCCKISFTLAKYMFTRNHISYILVYDPQIHNYMIMTICYYYCYCYTALLAEFAILIHNCNIDHYVIASQHLNGMLIYIIHHKHRR